ncbi:MAG: hypothetical protein HQ474_01665 [Flammeovirgaceae bacterium]|nr:hypothetical protein [Flammeovirgaceae bacterium]
MKRLLIALIVCFGFTGNVKAEPSFAIKSLMNEPLSLFDFGLYKLDKKIQNLLMHPNFDIEEERGSAFVSYDLDENIIGIFISFHSVKKATNIICNGVWEFAHSNLGYNRYYTGGKSSLPYHKKIVTSNYIKMFSHSGWQNKNLPKNYVEKIVDIIKINVSLRHPDGSTYKKCSGMLTDDKPMFSE